MAVNPERAERMDDLIAAADILAAAQAERRKAQRELDAAIASERDAALRCAELRALVASW
jgi:septal ring factor EnvC (AmiA/AmiB activator)